MIPANPLPWLVSMKGVQSLMCVPSLAACMCKLEAKCEVHSTKPTLVPTIDQPHKSCCLCVVLWHFYYVCSFLLIDCLLVCFRVLHHGLGSTKGPVRGAPHTPPNPACDAQAAPTVHQHLSFCTHTLHDPQSLTEHVHTLVYALMSLFYCGMILHVGTF